MTTPPLKLDLPRGGMPERLIGAVLKTDFAIRQPQSFPFILMGFRKDTLASLHHTPQYIPQSRVESPPSPPLGDT
jgi:hypothetical protein